MSDIPTIITKRRNGQQVFWCVACGREHYHGLDEGHHGAHCITGEDMSEPYPNGYNLVLDPIGELYLLSDTEAVMLGHEIDVHVQRFTRFQEHLHCVGSVEVADIIGEAVDLLLEAMGRVPRSITHSSDTIHQAQ